MPRLSSGSFQAPPPPPSCGLHRHSQNQVLPCQSPLGSGVTDPPLTGQPSTQSSQC